MADAGTLFRFAWERQQMGIGNSLNAADAEGANESYRVLIASADCTHDEAILRQASGGTFAGRAAVPPTGGPEFGIARR